MVFLYQPVVFRVHGIVFQGIVNLQGRTACEIERPSTMGIGIGLSWTFQLPRLSGRFGRCLFRSCFFLRICVGPLLFLFFCVCLALVCGRFAVNGADLRVPQPAEHQERPLDSPVGRWRIQAELPSSRWSTWEIFMFQYRTHTAPKGPNEVKLFDFRIRSPKTGWWKLCNRT